MKNLAAIRRVLYITMALNLVAMAAKLAVGYATGALSLVADGFDSLFDGAGNVIGLVGLFLAARPADPDHPYGHRKFETFTAVAIAMLLFVTTWELLQSAVERLRHPELIAPEVNSWSFGALALSILVHVGVSTYELRAGRRLKSDVLVADAMHTRADIYISLAVVGGLIAVRLGYAVVDPLLALVIAIVVLKIGVDIVRDSSKILLDGAAVPISEIERIVMGVRDVRSCHYVRSRGHEDAIYVDLHVSVAPEMTTAQSHAIAHDVQHRLKAEIPAIRDVVVHVEPADAGSGDSSALIPSLRALAAELDIPIHDIMAHRTGEGYRVEAHITVDGSLSLDAAHEVADGLEALARARIDGLTEITTHIEPAEDARDPEAPAMSADSVSEAVRAALADGLDAGQCHDIQVYPVGDNWAVSIHCALDGNTVLREAHSLSGELERRLRDTIPRLDRIVIHTEPLSEAAR